MSVLLPLVVTQNFQSDACFGSEQARLVAIAAALNAELNGMAFYNYGASKPSAENNIYPWLNTTDGRWYSYSGGWRSPVPSYSINERRLWMGTLVELQTYDGGDTNAPSTTSGPMWIADLSFTAKFLVHPGTFDGGTSVAVGANVGSDEVTLTADQLPDAPVVPLDATGNITSNRQFQKSGTVTGITPLSGDFSGTDSGGEMSNVLAKIEGDNQPFEILPPARGIYVIQRTARQFYVVP